MALTQVPESEQAPVGNPRVPVENERGIALFMVVAAMTVLSVLVTEFTYIAQVNQRMAFDGLDQIQALYTAKTGFKISLLRLKAYQQVKGYVGASAGAGAPAVPKSLIEKVWNFPFIYPFPTLPGMTISDKDSINKFQTESGLAGHFTATIESESSRYNLNQVITLAAPEPAASGNPSPTPQPSFNPDAARKSLQDYLSSILDNKVQADPDFAEEYRDFKIDELMDGILTWTDPAFQPKNQNTFDPALPKKAPFYSLAELHMIPPMDDQLFDLFSPGLTVSSTTGINVNSMRDTTLRALVPQMTKEEVDEFFKFRDSTEADNSFKKEDEFTNYIGTHVAAFHSDQGEIARFQANLKTRGIRLITDENTFKITVNAQVNQASRQIEAWVTLLPKDSSADPIAAAVNPPPPGSSNAPGTPIPRPKSGLKITFMRIL